MKEYLKHLWKEKLIILLIIFSSFLLGFTVTNVIKTYTSEYQFSFDVTAEKEISFDSFLSEEFLLSVQEDFQNKDNHYYDEIDVKEIISKNAISISNIDNTYTITTKSSYYEDFFIKTSKTVSTRAKTFLKTAVTKYCSANEYNLDLYEELDFKQISPVNNVIIYSVSAGTSLLLTSIYIFFSLFKFKKYGEIELTPYDNEKTFFSPFHKNYWKEALKAFKSVKSITVLAMLLGIMLICKAFSLPTGFGNLGISLTYIFFATAAMIYGPIAGFILGILSDVLGYILYQSSMTFFIGYTLQAALTGFIYGILLYRTRVSYSRCFIARIFVNFLMNVVVGSICWGIICSYTFDQTLSYALIFSLPKNIIFLVPQSLVLYLIIKALSPALYHLDLIEENQIEVIRIKKEKISQKENINA
ncbi:MAG: folate family ECF transporter S component [Bacilli bacterium]